MADTLPTPITRREQFLAAAAGATGITLPTPITREEQYLAKIAENGSGGGTSPFYPAGNIAFASLPNPSADILGAMYNITDAFTTDSRFNEGAGIKYPAGTNVAEINAGTEQSPVYKFDTYAGAYTVDDAFSATSENPVQNKVVKAALDNKVDKVEGKDLSTNDYTNVDKTKVSNSPISSSASGTSFAITDAADGHVQNIKIKGATDSTTAQSVGEGGSITITTTDGTKSTSATLTTGIPLRAYSETVYDELDMLSGTVITRCGFEDDSVTELATPIVTPLTSAEMSALTALETYSGTTNIAITDSPATEINYLRDTDNGQAAANMQVNILHATNPWNNAGAHNAIYRGKYLGSSVTDDQWAMIDVGTFDDLFIGDYWTIGSVNYRIAALDYYLGTGDTACSKHHAVIVPDTKLYLATMNTSATTAGGYVGSKMYTTNIPTDVLPIVETAFGAGHILERRESLSNAVTNGIPSGYVWSNVKVVLMTEMNVLGIRALSPTSNGSDFNKDYTCDSKQFPLFAFAPAFINIAREDYWLRDIVNSERFAYIVDYGFEAATGANSALGVRPSFSIYAG